MTTEFELFTYTVHNTLGVGHDAARTRKELCRQLNCGDRSLRRAIEYLRLNHPILTLDDGKGYYIPETGEKGIEDAQRWIKRQNRRIRSIKKAEVGVEKFIKQQSQKMKQVPGQIEMFGGVV